MNKLEAWAIVFDQVWWVMRWPLLCALWVRIGAGFDSEEDRLPLFPAFILLSAIAITLAVANE